MLLRGNRYVIRLASVLRVGASSFKAMKPIFPSYKQYSLALLHHIH